MWGPDPGQMTWVCDRACYFVPAAAEAAGVPGKQRPPPGGEPSPCWTWPTLPADLLWWDQFPLLFVQFWESFQTKIIPSHAINVHLEWSVFIIYECREFVIPVYKSGSADQLFPGYRVRMTNKFENHCSKLGTEKAVYVCYEYSYFDETNSQWLC
uniref:Uncharacterized protein n=1 Tax=Timema poppense TaxID=170557 RepID=A0A7R9H6U4_TIMPO|nr:unnamed protein product [Timema poppensis]